MVRTQLRRRGVRDPRVLDAMGRVAREVFVSEDLRERAYDDCALPIAAGQTISQPYIVALMVEALALHPGDRALEVGAGSGYAAAVMSLLAREVYAIERHEELVDAARVRLAELGIGNVRLKRGDGTLGWPEHGPYDAIAVAAGGPRVGDALLSQLAEGGRLVAPVGEDRSSQELVRITKGAGGALEPVSLGTVQFVPLVGREGWEEE